MADSKITALTELLSLAANDVLPIVEIASGTTKKVKYSTLLGALQTPWESNIDGNLKDLTNVADLYAKSVNAGVDGVVTDKIISLTDITITANGEDVVQFTDTEVICNGDVRIKATFFLNSVDNHAPPLITNSPPTFIKYYGTDASALADPDDWLPVKINNKEGVVPFYET